MFDQLVGLLKDTGGWLTCTDQVELHFNQYTVDAYQVDLAVEILETINPAGHVKYNTDDMGIYLSIEIG